MLLLLLCLVGCDRAIAPGERTSYRGDPITYLKDSRTGLCFAYMRGGQSQRGPALELVPCDAIPNECLKEVP